MKKQIFPLIASIIFLGIAFLISHKPINLPPNVISSTKFKYVAMVVEENHSFEEVIGNKKMPYLNSLASEYGLATQYYANDRGSLGDYFWLTAGQILTTNNSTTEIFNVDNIFRRLIEAKMTWKSYQQSLPSTGFTEYTSSGPYLKRHNPAAYFSDTVASDQKNNIVSTAQLEKDIVASNFSNFMFITPDADHDAHDGTLAQADDWVAANIKPLVENPVFKQDGLLIITFDEGRENDNRHGSGRVVTVLVSPKVKPNYSSNFFYQHQNLLKTVCDALSFPTCPGKANGAQGLDEFFIN